jgi:outer membrane protein assembly factor BamD (BamD/ComL family)
MRLRWCLTACGVVALAAMLSADIILSATALNDALKKMQRLRQTIESASGPARAEALFELATAADALTTLINDEVAEHGSQEKALIDLGIARTRELGIAIAYNAGKKKFFYDNVAYREYLAIAPRGAHAEQASFKLLEGEFFQAEPADIAGIEKGTERKRAFLKQYPASPGAPEVHLMLSVDYRDLFRHYDSAGDRLKRTRFRDAARQQMRELMKRFPNSEQAEIARRMLQRFDDELK